LSVTNGIESFFVHGKVEKGSFHNRRLIKGACAPLKDAYAGQFSRKWNFIFKGPKHPFFYVGWPLHPWEHPKTIKKSQQP